MKRATTIRTQPKAFPEPILDQRIDSILAAEDELLPSSGFLASVMEQVEQEAAMPPRLPFPWKRVIPGILFTAAAFTYGGYKLARLGPSALPAPSLPLPALHLPAVAALPIEQAGWIALALGLTLLSWLLSRRLVGRGGLL